MRYSYAYQDKQGIRHEASIEAESRDAAFSLLRKQGIRPIKVVAADGSKENGAPNGVRKRVVIAIVAISVLVAIAATVMLLRISEPPMFESGFQAEQTRRQIIGDAAIIEKGIRTGWNDVFETEGDRFFASFAIPGVKAGQRNTTARELESALTRKVEPSPNDGLEARQIMAMVEGMKAEARAYIAAGGNLVEYGKRLTERQDAEIAIYERAKADMERVKQNLTDAALMDYLEEQNDKLRNLGIRPITLESLE